MLGKTVHRSFPSEVLHYKAILGWGVAGLMQAAEDLGVCFRSQVPEKLYSLQELDMRKPPALQELVF